MTVQDSGIHLSSDPVPNSPISEKTSVTEYDDNSLPSPCIYIIYTVFIYIKYLLFNYNVYAI